MALAAGTRLGPYEILAPLGAGGMGEVYRAADTRLKRQVAVKILPPDLAGDVGRLARFQREAELLASLNHPHIAAIYGFEEAGASGESAASVRALVMELVDGPTLADRIAQGPVPVDEALAVARQIAEALEAAHEQGIVHRDLKPANIKVRDDGAVKVLDFGLAKTRDSAGSASDIGMTVGALSSPTMASPEGARGPVSQAGMILGTAAYMSPEQARGKAVDKRTDVWAFGAVLYEMLTGRRAFEGDDVAELIASVMKSTPDWSVLPSDTPPQVVTLLQRCLEKDKTKRIGDIAVARFLLSGDAAMAVPLLSAAATVAPAPRRRQLAPWIAAALVAGVFIGWLLPRRGVVEPITHLQMDVLPADELTPGQNARFRPTRTAVAISPDGRVTAFAGLHGTSAQLYVRTLDRADAAAFAGTDGAMAPFFSPDSAWIAFVADGRIKKVPAAGGPAAAICDLPAGPFWGGSWAEDGTIVYAARGGIFSVPAAGGTPSQITKLDPARLDRHLHPQLMPGGKFLVFTAPPNIVVRSMESGEQRTLVDGADARYVRTGHLVYVKNGTLMAVPFDARAGRLSGAPVALVENVMQGVNAGNSNEETLAGQFAISDTGTLVYASGGVFPPRLLTLMLVDRSGTARPLPGASPRLFLFPRISHDGQKVVVEASDAERGATDVWVYDITRGTPTRLTFDGGSRPVWSPDGARIVYSHFVDGVANLYVVNADGSGKPERLVTSAIGQNPASWASVTNTIAFMQRPTPDSFGIWTLPMGAVDARKPALFLESRFVLTYPEFSPDGHWMAYVSNESGTPEVYVQAFPGGGAKTRVSADGGIEPIWTANGRELLFRTGTLSTNRFMSAAIRSTSPLQVDPPRLLFEVKAGEYDATTPVRAWDATPDAQRFILTHVDDATVKPVTTLNVVLHWTNRLRGGIGGIGGPRN